VAYNPPTYDEMADFLVAHLKMLFPDLDVSRTSFPALLAKTFAAGVTDNHAHIRGVLADLLPDTAEGPALDRWGGVVGVARKGATVARKAAALTVVNSGAVDRSLTIGTELVHSSGLRFALNETATVTAGTSRNFAVVSIDTGSQCRLDAEETLTFSAAPPAGIEETAELALDIDQGGDDAESDGDYRRRILARFQTPPLGGAQADYVAWSLALEGIDAAYCYPARQGLGTVDVAALHAGSGADRLLSGAERTALLGDLETKRPVGVTLRVLETLEQVTSVEVTVADTGEPAYAWDWDDQSPLQVDSWNAGTRTITFAFDRPDSMEAGHRIIIADAAGDGDGRQYVIESLSGTDAVVLEEQPTGHDGADLDPINGDTVYSGGELVDAVRDAVKAHIDQLGTANPDATNYGAWEGNLRVGALYREVTAVAGVRDGTVVSPAANVEATDPAFPDDDTIYLITPGRLLVHREW
jgi:uncharacterized phage protein gp47/JayE